ncbi:hypothetical protein ACS0TY_005791 [Phlomoides rotata]
MATYTLALSTPKPLFSYPKQSFQKRLNPINKFHVSNSCDQSSHKHALSLQQTSSFSSRHNKRLWNLIVRSEAISEVANTDGWIRTLQLAAMFAIWYTLNIYFNIFNKQVLKVYTFPATVTAIQFGCGSVMIFLMWALNLHPKPKLRRSQFSVIFLLAVGHTIGNLLTNISLGKVAVSFTHTIKAMEPFFTVLLSALFFGEFLLLCLLLVVWLWLHLLRSLSTGFSCAMASNLTNQTRNVFSKKFMVREEETLDNINLFSLMTIISFLLLAPAAILLEGVKFSPSYLQNAASQGLNVKELCIRALLSGFCFHTYQQVSSHVNLSNFQLNNILKQNMTRIQQWNFGRYTQNPLFHICCMDQLSILT